MIEQYVKYNDSPWIEVEAYVDKEAIAELLSPSGSLMKHLIVSRFDQDIRYEFPIDLLPVRPFNCVLWIA